MFANDTDACVEIVDIIQGSSHSTLVYFTDVGGFVINGVMLRDVEKRVEETDEHE